VTHDQEEALTMSDRIAVMNEGVLEQLGTPDEIYEHPKTKFVADFIGETNLFEAYAESELPGGNAVYRTAHGSIAAASLRPFHKGQMTYVSVRPEKVLFSQQPLEGFTLRGTVRENIYIGTHQKSIVRLADGGEVRIVTAAGSSPPRTGSEGYLCWKDRDAVLIACRTGEIRDAADAS